MCLITKEKNVSIAKRDKTGFKWIRIKSSSTLWSGPIYSREDFPFNEIVTAKDCCGKEIDHLRFCGEYPFRPGYEYIEEGIHSYRIRSLEFLYCYRKICVIPKGSEYCYGTGGEAVSTKIIVFSSYKKYFQYKWKKLLEKIF